ncbi:1-deoxy-D-xylulose-5-phosphate reductoisomerase [Oceanicaulis sp. AH-315-P02]|nr:1-deoxy-D-xylulose-5-phosphate reductoisomerase [Oceanicaulis sp. AH-315-P02]
MASQKTRTVTVLGATGSIGDATLDIVRQQQKVLGKASVSIKALTAGSNWQKLARLAMEFEPDFVALFDVTFEKDLREALSTTGVEVAVGAEAIKEAASLDAKWVMAAITGSAGLPSILTAAKRGCTLALANKESLVCAGPLLLSLCADNGTTLLPVDSEHNAIFQVFDASRKDTIEKITLTASGGPFRNWSAEQIAAATPAQAIAHPVWSMGAKISVDSASLMNKGLELIEARHLFDVSPDQLEILVHPQSVVHGMVQYKDGSILAQLGPPDMRVPIASAWAWPDRIEVSCDRLSLAKLGRLDFEAPDEKRFPALKLARHAMQMGANACNALSAANEVAVASFLQEEIKFFEINEVVSFVLSCANKNTNLWLGEPSNLEEVFEIDNIARRTAQQFIVDEIR